MLENIQDIDRAITLAINSLSSPLSDAFWQFMSDTRVWIPFYIVLLIKIYMRMGLKRTLVVTLAIALTVVVCDQFAGLVKDWICRPRPCYDDQALQAGLNVLERRKGQYGFFSAHAANAFGVAVCSILSVRIDMKHRAADFAAVMLVWACLVSISRVFVGKHFFGDVITGAAFGTIVGYLSAGLARQIIYRIERL